MSAHRNKHNNRQKFSHSTIVWSLPIFYNTVLQLQCKMFRSKGIMFIVYVQANWKVWVHTETSTITDKSSPTALLCEACQYFIT